MKTINSGNNYTITTTGCNSTISSGYYHIDEYIDSTTSTTIEYIDFIAEILGIDINYEKFKKMSDSDKKSFLREIKINNILK
jgi:hypothetical protein